MQILFISITIFDVYRNEQHNSNTFQIELLTVPLFSTWVTNHESREW